MIKCKSGLSDVRRALRDAGYVSNQRDWEQIDRDQYQLVLENHITVRCRCLKPPRMNVRFVCARALKKEMEERLKPIIASYETRFTFPPDIPPVEISTEDDRPFDLGV